MPSDLYVDDNGHVITNTPPVISGSNGGLGTFGDTPPSYQYTVTDAQGGAVSVSERVDGTNAAHLSAVARRPEHGFHSGEHTWKSLANGSHSLVITATDSAGASVTRTMTFTKNATAPAITGTDTSLGSFAETAPSYQYTVTDAQGGTVTVTETLDGAVRRTYAVTLGQINTLTFSAEEWRKILNGTHTIRVQAVDPLGLTTVRTVTFTKNVTSLAFEQTAAMNADAMPDRCIVNIQGEFPAGSSLTVEICNNGNDASPTWENITQNVLNGQRYFFTNQAEDGGKLGRAAARQPLARDGFRPVLYCIVRRELPVIKHKETSILAQRAQEQEEQRKARLQGEAVRLGAPLRRRGDCLHRRGSAGAAGFSFPRGRRRWPPGHSWPRAPA